MHSGLRRFVGEDNPKDCSQQKSREEVPRGNPSSLSPLR